MVEGEGINYYDVDVEVEWVGTRADRKELRSSKAEPGGGPRGRRGACGSGTNEGSKIPRGNHGLRCGR